jgi:hypothetical protein
MAKTEVETSRTATARVLMSNIKDNVFEFKFEGELIVGGLLVLYHSSVEFKAFFSKLRAVSRPWFFDKFLGKFSRTLNLM